jgi:hypothetical protein
MRKEKVKETTPEAWQWYQHCVSMWGQNIFKAEELVVFIQSSLTRDLNQNATSLSNCLSYQVQYHRKCVGES